MLRVGLRGTARETVTNENIARKFGSGSVPVYATPAMVALMEKASLSIADPLLPEGQVSVGTKLEIQHLAATLPGEEVTSEAELIEISGRRLVFKVEAFDSREKVGTGVHERYVVSLDKFLQRAAEKGARDRGE